jgi:5-formyltetrahydrofolate cyclo-ligase
MSAPETAEGKAAVRAEVLSELRHLRADDRAARSAEICRRVVGLDAWARSRAVVLFLPMRVEPDIAPLRIAAEQSGKHATAIPSDIRDEAALQLPFTPDLILVPGVAFSTDGHRLGRGGGFYDRLLAGRASAAFKLGVCFRLQLRASIPCEQHDIVLDLVITD